MNLSIDDFVGSVGSMCYDYLVSVQALNLDKVRM